MAMKVDRIMLLFFVSSWMIIHFGKNPVRGGSPPSDSKTVRIIIVIRGVLFQVLARDRVVVVVVVMRSINMVRVIII